MQWFRKAAEQGYAKAQNQLGEMYYFGHGGLPQDKTQAVQWFRKAAEQGETHARWELKSMAGLGNVELRSVALDPGNRPLGAVFRLA